MLKKSSLENTGGNVQYLYYKEAYKGCGVTHVRGSGSVHKGARIHKVAMRRCGHKGCISTGTDARVGGTMKVRVRHVIDRGRRRGTVCKASCLSLGIRR